jgi:hypothetical protein
VNDEYTYLVGGLHNKGLHPDKEQEKLNECGSLGWMLVSVIVRSEYTLYYFRREKRNTDNENKPRFDLTMINT